jgi:signal transduction histidine kinase
LQNRRSFNLLSTIRGRLILLVAAVAIPAGIFASVMVVGADRNQRERVEYQLAERAKAMALAVDRQLGQAEALLLGLATSPALSSGDLATFYQQAARAVPEPNRWIVLTGPEGQQFLNTFRTFGSQLPTTSLHREYEHVWATGGVTISDMLPSAVIDSKVVSVGIPVTVAGEPRALALVMQPSSLRQALGTSDLAESWIASLIDRNGIIVARSRLAEDFVGGYATPLVRQVIRESSSGILEGNTLDGIRTVAAFERAPQSAWTVMIGAPRSELFASARARLWAVIAGSTLIVLLGGALAFLLARSVSRSVEALAGAAQSLGRGRAPDLVATGMEETDELAAVLQEAGARLAEREADLQRLNASLEARVQERTGELATANRELLLRNRDLSDFAHVASHDLQEPLRQIESFASVLAVEIGPAADDSSRHLLQRIQVAAQRMRKLVRDLLDLSQVAGQIRSFEEVDLTRTIKEVINDLSERIAASGGQVEYDQLGTVRADAVQMHQLLLNLVGNGLKFRRAEEPPRVRVRREEIEGSVVIEVEDNGIGFPEEYAERIFRPFERLNALSDFEGSGVGLAIVQRIVERHGGSIVVSSYPGQGSRFRVCLPKLADTKSNGRV